MLTVTVAGFVNGSANAKIAPPAPPALQNLNLDSSTFKVAFFGLRQSFNGATLIAPPPSYAEQLMNSDFDICTVAPVELMAPPDLVE